MPPNGQDFSGSAPSRGGSASGGINWLPAFLYFFSFICSVFWVGIILDEISTSEAWMMHASTSLVPRPELLWQPIAFIMGWLPADQIAAVIVGWVVELLVMIATFCLEMGVLISQKHNALFSGWFKKVCIGAFAYDALTNFFAHAVAGDARDQVAFVVGLAVGAAFLPYGIMSMLKFAHAESSKASGKEVPNPLPKLFYGFALFCVLFWIGIIIDEIQTSEMWLLHSPSVAQLQPHLDTLYQPIAFILGALPTNMIAPVLIGWIVELMIVISTLVLEMSIAFSRRYNASISGWFKTACILSFVYDAFTNWQSHLVTGDFLHQLAFIACLAIGAAFLPFGTLALLKVAQMEA